MRINVHAGHNPDGKTACGAVGLLRESTEARKVKTYLIKFLEEQGHTVYDCTVDNGTSQSNILKRIVQKCNAHRVNLDISIHLNSGASDRRGNGKTTGTECWIYGTGGNAEKYAKRIQQRICKRTGYKNRGIKVSKSLYVLKHTIAPAVLVECCFVDDKDDAENWNAKKMAAAICEGITGKWPM